MKNSICWFAGSFRSKPKNVRKLLSPLVPLVKFARWLPSTMISVENAAASAWDRIAKYAPLTRRLNTPRPSSSATTRRQPRRCQQRDPRAAEHLDPARQVVAWSGSA